MSPAFMPAFAVIVIPNENQEKVCTIRSLIPSPHEGVSPLAPLAGRGHIRVRVVPLEQSGALRRRGCAVLIPRTNK